MKDMFRKAIRLGWEELSRRAAERHLERELELRLGFWAAEAAVGEVIAQAFGAPVAGADWETRFWTYGCSDGDYLQTLGASCREAGASATEVRLSADVRAEREEDEKVTLGVIRHDPPKAAFEPVLRELDTVAAEVMGQIPGSTRGRLHKVFTTAEFDLHLPLPRLDAAEALRRSMASLPAYEGAIGQTSSLRLDAVPSGAATLALHSSVHREPDESVVFVTIWCHLRSVDDRADVEKRLDRAVALLNVVG